MDTYPELSHRLAAAHLDELRDVAAGVRYRRRRRRSMTADPNHGSRTDPRSASRR